MMNKTKPRGSGITRTQRFTPGHPCPICGGHDQKPRGRGARCHGFISADGCYAHCVRPERAGQLDLIDDSQTYAHRLVGACGCGDRHGGDEPPPAAPRSREATGRLIEEARYDYHDEQGRIVHTTIRFQGKQFRQCRPDGKGGHVWSLKGVELVLFGIPTWIGTDPSREILFVEGEKDALTAQRNGFVATTSPMGAGKIHLVAEHARRVLRGRHVVIVPDLDLDGTGQRHAEDVARFLHGAAASLRVLELPDGAHDLTDWFERGGTTEKLTSLIKAAPRREDHDEEDGDPEAKPKPETGRDKRTDAAATQLVKLATEHELFVTPDGASAWATIPIGNHRETYAIQSSRFREWLAFRFFQTTGTAVSSQAIKSALHTVAGHAMEVGNRHAVHTRVAEVDGRIYLDLCDEACQVVEVTAEGRRLVTDSPVKFRRTRGMLPLPAPVPGGRLDELRGMLNIGSDADWIMMQGWLVSALQAHGAYPLLAIHGEQGSAKSTTTRMLRALIDPNTASLRAPPRSGRDLMISAHNAWMIVFDNFSSISNELSDALCRLSTGGGFSTRQLRTDDDEILFEAKRPVILNGIEEVVTRPDLLERAVMINLPVIPEERRRTDREIWAAFEAARGRLLGAILDGVSAALRGLASARPVGKPRMLDFAEWATAAEPGLGLAPGAFMAAYHRNQAAANDAALEESPIASALRGFAAEHPNWSGTAAELLLLLVRYASHEVRSNRDQWPQTACGLVKGIQRVAPNLRAAGIEVQRGEREPGGMRRRLMRVCVLGRAGAVVPEPAPATANEIAPVVERDGWDGVVEDPIVPDPDEPGQIGEAREEWSI